jgi:hypothetical protein
MQHYDREGLLLQHDSLPVEEAILPDHNVASVVWQKRWLDKSSISNRLELLRNLVGKVGDGTFIEPPFLPDYGCNIMIGNLYTVPNNNQAGV